MADPRSTFVEAMHYINDTRIGRPADDVQGHDAMHRSVIAFADAFYGVGNKREQRRLLREVGLETDCAHEFEANHGLYDSMHRYCRKCGRAE